MKKKALQVTLDVREPSVIELTIGDKVQLDRLTPSDHGYVPVRHGAVLDPGAATLALERGFYLFRTLCDANLKVVRGGCHATPSRGPVKCIPPPPFSKTDDEGAPAPTARGDEGQGELPNLTVE